MLEGSHVVVFGRCSGDMHVRACEIGTEPWCYIGCPLVQYGHLSRQSKWLGLFLRAIPLSLEEKTSTMELTSALRGGLERVSPRARLMSSIVIVHHAHLRAI